MRSFPLAAVLFISVPILEIYLFIKLGGIIGALPTIALIFMTALVGVTLLRAQGLATLKRFQDSMAQGELPAFTMLEGVLLMFGGALLLTPGFFTDTIGFLCLIPPTRHMLIKALIPYLNISMRGATSKPRDGQVLEGEYTVGPKD